MATRSGRGYMPIRSDGLHRHKRHLFVAFCYVWQESSRSTTSRKSPDRADGAAGLVGVARRWVMGRFGTTHAARPSVEGW